MVLLYRPYFETCSNPLGPLLLLILKATSEMSITTVSSPLRLCSLPDITWHELVSKVLKMSCQNNEMNLPFPSLLSFPHPSLHPRACVLPARGFPSLRNHHGLCRSLVLGSLSLFFFCLFSATRALLNWMDCILHVRGARFLTQKNTDGGFIHVNVSFTSRYETGAEIVWF